jgi:Flp pilus assembly protein TadG
MATTYFGNFFRKLQTRLKLFPAAQGGNTAIIFALAIIPLFGSVGAAVDYSRANSVKAAMQAALDSAALMLAREASGLTAGQMTQKANQYFQASFHRPDAHNIRVTPEYASIDGGFTLTIRGAADVDVAFVRIFGINQLHVTTLAQVNWGIKRLELALVLDNTGSMAEYGKINALKTATREMLSKLKSVSSNGDDLRVSIVPFDTHVNIGAENRNKPWIDWSTYRNDNDLVRRVSLSSEARAHWNGCIIDRDQPHDVRNTAPSRDPNTFYPAVDCGLASIQPLTSNWSDLDRKVGQMKSSGFTDLTIGLVWGWNMLTPDVPLSTARPSVKDLNKVIVFLTDGKNTQNRWSSNQNEIDARTKTVCDNLRDSGIKVFTVRVIEGNASLLRGCATQPDMYYEVTQASGISAAFAQITDQLTKIHISR